MEEKIDQIIKMLKEISQEDRVDVLDKIREIFCIHCGGEAGCQCWNDE